VIDPLSPDEQATLLALARKSIRDVLQGRDRSPEVPTVSALGEKRGAFVTLRIEGELRGCIGYPLPHKALYETVAETAVAAATQDFRFQPLRPGELDKAEIEISVLSRPRPVDAPEDVEVGVHGIIISKGFQKGLLLPQVPVEHAWDRETYLRHGCLKAGLGPDEWRKGAKIEVFTAQVFSDAGLRGAVGP
jgi:AmmeMemoRadiSam system protein A